MLGQQVWAGAELPRHQLRLVSVESNPNSDHISCVFLGLSLPSALSWIIVLFPATLSQ